ncbi:UNVERIFIED_CONTAM: hypothetical protein FKN15_015596 [Acipenser sinensis]
MGKNHKKHKSEKHAYEEYAEKPLKLVLKVGGSEVTELSTASSGHDSSILRGQVGPRQGQEEEKETEKKGQDSMDTDVDERSQTPVRAEMLHEKHMSASLAKVKAEKVTGNLKHLASQVTPGDITSVYGIRKVMGIAVPACLHYCWSRAW